MRSQVPGILALLSAGCASVGGGPEVAGRPPSDSARATFMATSYDTTWYISNRRREAGELSRDPTDSLEYGLIVTRYRERAGPGSDGRILEDADRESVDSARFSRAEFLTRLRMRLADSPDPKSGAIIYVHGYAVSFALGIAQGADIGHRISHTGATVVFAWPAHASVVAWPSAAAVVSRAYRDDSATAAESGDTFLSAVSAVREAAGSQPTTVIGHSLGGQLVTEALTRPGARRDSLVRRPLSALVLFAADVNLARLRDSLASTLAAVAARRIVYASDDDLMMDMSRFINKSERAGEATPALQLTARGFEVVDVTRGRRVNGALRKIFEPGHGMRFAATALFDFAAVVRGVPAGCRVALGLATRMEDGSWRLLNGPIPRDPPRAESREC
ncbi:MAG: alpha/beta hydrolase [Gemmatimonadota bacterium]|nr:alpha/beta hydrolase [Gemmatimonadota bacterium]